MMSKRLSGGQKVDSYEHVLMCLICRSLFDDYDHQPKFLPCHHTFCKDCLREYVKQAGDEIECPSCRKTATVPTAGVVALQTNFYVRYIQSLVYGSSGSDDAALECDIHAKNKLLHYCKECCRSVCTKCCEGDSQTCAQHKKISLTAITEEYHQKLDSAFAKANSVIERKKMELEAMMKCFCEEKDQAMRKIDATFEQHVHTLTRRSTLLKNKVIAIYNEHVENLENDMEEISTAMTCIVSLKEYHEDMIGKGHFIDTQKGIAELDEVFNNITTRIKPKENHIVFEENHGVDKYKVCAKDLGRVRNNKPTLPRTEPEGATLATPSPSLDQSQGQDAATGFSMDTQGAVGGPEESFTDVNSGLCAADETSRRECDYHGDNPASKTFQGDGRSSIASRCDTGGRGPAPQHNSSLNAHGHSLYENNKLDINSNAPITVPGVVRPKTLSGMSRASPTVSISTSSSLPKSTTQNGLIKRDDNSKCNKKTTKASSGTATVIGSCVSTGRLSTGELSTGGLSALHSLHRSDPGPEMYTLSALQQESPGLALDPEIENLKQADKMYHHLVYTSYDEEELLKELKCGKVHFDPDGGTSLPAKQSSMSDSDSMMTVSSDSTLSGNSDDLTISAEQSRL